MNKNLYRIVFNKARGVLMVVPDIAASGRAASSPSEGVGHTQHRCMSRLGRISFSLLLAMGCVSTPAWADIVADGSAPGQQQPTIINSANGTPQINIQTPSAAGVSQNKYSQFDIDQKGAILNNSHQMTQTQLGGMVAANPWLAKGEAKVILNEVNSRDPSQLNGMLEVAGRQAQIVIANPAGITCNGCGFINANRTTLTTGQVQLSNGQITGYDVSRGTITVQGRGMDSSRQNTTELIARAVKVNATIQARELEITTGRNNVRASDRSATAKSDDGSARPQFAVDVAQLGGMYANKIQLRGTESGVGVHNAGTIGASAGDVVVNADGSITNSGLIQASNNVQLASRNDISSHGVLAAGMKADGTASAAGDLAMQSEGKLTVSGQNSAVNKLTAKGTSIDFSASQNRAGSVELAAAQGDVHTQKANVAAQQITVSTNGMLNNDGGSLSADKLNLTASQLSNRQGLLQQSGDSELTLAHAGGIDNRGGNIVANSKKLTLSGAKLDNQQGRIQADAVEVNTAKQSLNNQQGVIAASKSVKLQSGGLNNDEGLVQAGTDLALDLQGGALSNRNSGKKGIFSNGALTVNGGALDNQHGVIASAGGLQLNGSQLNNDAGLLQSGSTLDVNVQGGSLTNRSGGNLSGKGALSLKGGALDNSSGVIASTQSLSLNGSQLNNDTGLLQAVGDLSLDLAGGTFTNRNSGKNGGVLSQGQLTVQSGALDNSGGFIASGKDASLTTLALNNTSGTLASDGTLSLINEGINNQQGLIQAGKSLSLDTRGGALVNSHGELTSGKHLTLLSGVLLNDAGRIVASEDARLDTLGNPFNNQAGTIAVGGEASITAHALNNTGGQVQVAGNLQLTTQNALENGSGLIRSGKTATLNAASIVNRTTHSDQQGIEGQSVTLNTGSLNNIDGAVRSSDTLTLNSGGVLDNTRGLLSSGNQLTVNGGQSLALTNSAGTLIAGKMLTLDAGSATGDGKLLSQDAMALNLQKALLNVGQIIANGNVSFTFAEGLINEGLAKAGGVMTMNVPALLNRSNGEISAGETHLLVSGALTNWGLLDGGLTHISAGTLNNYGTGRIYGDRVALQAGTLNNEAKDSVAPVIAARQRLDLGVGTLNNVGHAMIYSAGDVAIGGSLNDQWQAQGQALTFNNHSSTLESAGNMTLNIGEINNLNDNLKTQVLETENSAHHEAALKGSPTHYDWSKVDTSKKNKYGVHTAKMPDGSQSEEFYEYSYQRTVKETQVVETDPGKIIAGGNLTINSNQLNNRDSTVVAGGLLGGTIVQLNNLATLGERVITDVGSQTRWYAKKKKKKLGGTKTSQGKDTSSYKPAVIIQKIDLKQMAWQGNALINGSGTAISSRDTGGVTTHIIDPGKLDAALAQRPVTVPPGKIVEIASGPDSAIRLTPPDLRLPDNSLYQLHPSNDVPFLIETDPRFTNQKQWLSSDYMQSQFALDGGNILKRLGDGFYEQNLIRQQITELTGNRFLKGFDNDENQYRALMDAGVAFGKQYNLTPGVALTPQQMALLTSDMVWLVKQDVTLPDGSVQSVLVPQVYARVRPGDLDGSGALMSGGNIALNVKNDLTNSGHISGREITQITAENITNSGYLGGNRVSLQARTDINNIGGTLQASDGLIAVAGRDINSTTTTRGDGTNSWIDRPAGIFVQNDGGELGLQALNNISLTGSLVSNSGANSKTRLLAGNDLSLNTVTTTHSESGDWGGGNDRHVVQTTDVGSQINGNGTVALSAGHDVNARAASVTAADKLAVAAGNDINITSGESSYQVTENSRQSSGGWLSKKTITTHDDVKVTDALGSTLDGDSITLQAGNNLTVKGSSVAATHDVNLSAGNDLTLTTAENTRQENHQYQEKTSGLSGTGGIGVSYGKSELKTTDDGKSLSSTGSTVGSTAGNVNLSTGNALTVKGSEVLAKQDLLLTGKDVSILAAENQSTQTHITEQKTSGLTLALSGVVGSAVNQAVSQANSARKESNGRLATLQGVQSALSGVEAYQGNQLNNAEGGSPGSVVGVNLSWGSQSSTSTQTQTSNQSQGSQLTAGNNLTIKASEGDIRVQGSELQAGKDMLLNAKRDVLLESALNSQKLDGKNESHGSAYGVGINFGSGANGISVNASANKGKGNEKGTGTSHTETTLNAGNNLNIVSGRDTTLSGAQASGNSVKMDVGRNLQLTSEQDTDNYDSKQTNMSAGGSASMGGGSLSLNASRDKMHSTYASVQEQTGIFAGKGGFDITVGEHTQLNGAVIGSTADAGKNKLDTGTLGFKDIENSAEYKVEHQSVGISSGGSVGSQFLGNVASGLLVGANGSGSASSTTKSAVSEGTIVIRDKEKQQQDVANLSRDADHANQTLSPIFDKEKEQNRLREAQLIGEVGVQAGNIAATQGKIEATRVANEKMKSVTPEQLQAAKEALIKASPDKTPTDAEVASHAYQSFYDRAFADSDFGTGGKVQRAIQAATAAVQGLAGGDLAKAVAGGSAPYIANIIGSSGLDAGGKVLAHAAVNAALAAAQGNNALVGASGAATAELVGMVATNAYGKPVSELSETEKQTVSALATLAAGLAGGLTGNSTADAVAGAQTGKTTVENNWLSEKEARQLDKEMQECKKSGGDCKKVVEKYIDISNKNSKELIDACTGGGVACVSWEELIQANTNVALDANKHQVRLSEKLNDPDAAAIVKYLNGSDLKFLNDNITTSDRVMDVIMTPTSWPVAVMGGKAIITNAVNNSKELLVAVGITGAASAGIQYGTTGEVKLSDVIGSVIVGGITVGKGYNPTVTWNAASGYYQAEISGDDPFIGALMSKAGASVGYVAGNIIKVPFDKKLNPISKQYEWVPTGVWTITKPVTQNPLPSIVGNAGDSAASGLFTEGMNEALKNKKGK
ncbi:hemagglutinin repeat-containing protein [Cedecea sp. USHLN005]|uniref:hemagglutinin repeat-containing protein n=1 Tax=Cedecea sp. USHLN005 TaxID=3081239 RepID=UPI003018715D